MKKKILSTVLLLSLLGGCTSASTKALNNAQNNEITMLQNVKREILMRVVATQADRIAKEADLKMINDQIKTAMTIQQNAQSITNQQTDNTINSVITGVGTLGAAAWGIYKLTN